MKISSNEKKISRNSTIGFVASLASPILLMYSAFTILNEPDQFYKIFPYFALGIILFQIGISFKKYGRRSDKEFNKSLSKLDNKYKIFHFVAPIPHLIVGPAGIWILLPKYAQGEISFNAKRKRWKLKRSNLFNKIFFLVNDGIGRPDFEIMRHADVLDYHLQKKWDEKENIQINAVVVLMSDKAEVIPSDFPIPTVHIRKLRSHLRNQERKNKISKTVLNSFSELFK